MYSLYNKCPWSNKYPAFIMCVSKSNQFKQVDHFHIYLVF